MKIIIGIFFTTIIFIACSSPAEEEVTDKKIDSTLIATSKDSLAGTDYFKRLADSAEIPSFGIVIQLDDKAEKEIRSKNESIIVAAYFSGIPKDTTKYAEDGEYPVAEKRIELTDSRVAAFSGIKISEAMYESLANKDIEVLINVFSGRRSSKVNMLDCEIFQKPISKVMNQKLILKGKLIGN